MQELPIDERRLRVLNRRVRPSVRMMLAAVAVSGCPGVFGTMPTPIGTPAMVIAAGQTSAVQTFRERVDVLRVSLDVRVIDERDRPVPGLGPADFRVRLGGRLSAVETARWISATPDTDITSELNAPQSSDRSSGQSIVLIFQRKFDLSDAEGQMRIRDDLGSFLERLRPTDSVAVLSFDSALHVWADFGSDLGEVRQLVTIGMLAGAPRIDAGPIAPQSIRASTGSESARGIRTFEGALEAIARAMDARPGAKTIVVFGYGAGTWAPRLGLVTMDPDYDRALEALQRSGVSVFCVDVTRADYHPRQEGLTMLAEQTGGFYMQSHVFSAAVFDRLAGALAGRYVLGVIPATPLKGTQSVDVRLNGQKGTVIAKRVHMVH
jgi:VWFA-related protein